MFCSKCGAQNPDNVQSCSQCGGMLIAVTQQAVVPPKTSRAAIASFVMGLLGLIVCPLMPLLFIPAVICGVVGLVKISNSNGRLKGNGFAIAGLAISALMLVAMPFQLAILMPALSKTKKIAQRVICGTNLKTLQKAIMVYSNDYDGRAPTPDKWCDLLAKEVYYKSLICPDSDAVEGESTYAMNIHAAGKNLGDLPADMVLLFETDTNQLLPGQKPWNLAGGPELLQVRHSEKGQQGCNVVFVDGHAEFVKTQDIPNLRWTAEDK